MKSRILIFAPREEPLGNQSEIEYRESIITSYIEKITGGNLFGRDFTSVKEFLGVGCLHAALEQHGYSARTMIANNLPQYDDASLVREICDYRPDYLAVSVLYDLQLYNALIISEAVRQRCPQIKIIFGGPLPSLNADLLLNKFPYIDYILFGEGEEALPDLIRALDEQRNLCDVRNLCFRHQGAVRHNPLNTNLDLDTLPWPRRDVLEDMKRRNLPVKSAYIYTSRGCGGTCTFCSVPKLYRDFQTKWRGRSVSNIVDEMVFLHQRYNVRFFYLTDDNFMCDHSESGRQRLYDLAEEILKRNLKISFHAECRVDCIDEDLLVTLKKAGLTQLLFGIESGCPVTLKRWGKKQDIDTCVRAIALGRKLKFEVIPSIILLDWESTFDEVRETVAFIRRHKLYEIQYPLSLVNKLHVISGTAAAKRYDHVNGGRTPMEIRNHGDLKNWIIHHAYYDVAIKDSRVSCFWDTVLDISNRWSYYSQDVIPKLLMDIRTARRIRTEADMRFLRCCSMWRKELGAELVNMMEYTLDRISQAGSHRQVMDDVNAWVRESERKYFAADVFTYIESYIRQKEQGGLDP